MKILEAIRGDVAKRLRSRSVEIEEAILTRIRNTAADPIEEGDVEYEAGQRAAIAALLRHAVLGIRDEAKTARPAPLEAVAQVHRAARAGVGMNVIIRRYAVGFAEFGDFVIQEADGAGLLLHGNGLRSVQRTQAGLFEHLIVTINKEYGLETDRIASSAERRSAKQIRRLLAYGASDPVDLDYDFDSWHLAVIGTGRNAVRVIRNLANQLHCRLLDVSYDDQSVWAWLGGDRKRLVGDYERLSSIGWPVGVSLAVGQPAEGFDGWRLTHGQAQDARLLALCRPQTLTLYSEAALLAPWLRDRPRARALVAMYLSPLDEYKCVHPTLRETLRGFFAGGRNASQAARNLSISRRAMRNRMLLVERALGSLLDTNQAELELALRLEELL